MRFKLYLIRKTKALFIRLQLHRIVEPFSGMLLNLAYLSKISKWVKENRNIELNDFYASKWDYERRYKLYEYILGKEKLTEQLTYLEFGVAGGLSFKWWVSHNKHPESRFYGFDTFEGLPENWGHFKAGDMSTGSQFPEINDNRGAFVKGLFQDTLPPFLKERTPRGRLLVHLDADLYSSTLYVLTSMAPYLKPGDILMFDEFTVPRHEFLAYTNFLQSYYLKFDLIAAQNNYFFVAFKMK